MRVGHDQTAGINDAAAAERITGGTSLRPQKLVEQLLEHAQIIRIVHSRSRFDDPFRADVDDCGEGLFDGADHFVAAVGTTIEKCAFPPGSRPRGAVEVQQNGKYQNNQDAKQKKT